jgi:hypothetical protein
MKAGVLDLLHGTTPYARSNKGTKQLAILFPICEVLGSDLDP